MPLNLIGKLSLRLGAVAIAALLTGCATPPPDDDPDAKTEFEQLNDPLEPTNRAIFSFNEGVDEFILRPAAKGYRYAVPAFGRDRISDFLENLKFPIYLANDLLQGNVNFAGITTGRFLLNSTFGVLGVMDVADPMGLPSHKSDFGQTLGVWGVGEGFYLVLPFFGPSNPRDATGIAVEWFADPVDIYFQDEHLNWVTWVHTGANAIVTREAYLDLLDDVKRTSLDYYSALRSLYRQRRAAEIETGKHPGTYAPAPKSVQGQPTGPQSAQSPSGSTEKTPRN